MFVSEIVFVYAALIFHDDNSPIMAEKIITLLKAANQSMDSFWASLFSKLLEKNNLDDLILGVRSGLFLFLMILEILKAS